MSSFGPASGPVPQPSTEHQPASPKLDYKLPKASTRRLPEPVVPWIANGLLTLLLVYRLIERNYPKWIAICVVVCMGTNSWFVRLSHEVLTDMPFLLGAIAALLGWDMLRTARETKSRVKAAILMSAGLLL